MLILRPYQQNAVAAVYRHLREREDNPCVVIPTGGGKTPVMATLCNDAVSKWGGRVLVLAHVRELLEQTAGTLAHMAPGLDVGVYSAGLGRRDTASPVIVAGIQSVFRRPADLGPFDLVIVDEAHMIPPDGEGMYQTFLAEAKAVNPNVRLIGLTATPYRMATGMICEPDHLLNEVCYEVGVKELIRDGYLCPLKSKVSVSEADTSGLHVRAGEFIPSEVESLMDDAVLVSNACAEIVERSKDRRAVLIFASGIKHAEHVVETLMAMGMQANHVIGDTPSMARAAILCQFRDGALKYLVNVNVLTTGFDAPNVDCVALLRPTLSPGLYYQMVGRGFRTCEGKPDCLVLDFGGNILRHGPVDMIRIRERGGSSEGKPPVKVCPFCRSVIGIGYTTCPDCGQDLPAESKPTHDGNASTAGVLSGETVDMEYAVQETFYAVHEKRGAPERHPRTMRVEYRVGYQDFQSEWICIEHEGYAWEKAAKWWRLRSDVPMPRDAETAVMLARAGALCVTTGITVRTVVGEPYGNITKCAIGEKPVFTAVVTHDIEDAEDDVTAWREEPQRSNDDDLPF